MSCPAEVAEVHPGIKQASGQGLDGKEVHGTKIVQGFHQHQGKADGYRRSGDGQNHPEERAQRGVAETAADREQRRGLFQKGGAGQKVNVGIQDQPDHQRGAFEAANFREPVVCGTAPAEQVSQGTLNGASVVQEACVHIGNNVGGHCKW